MMDALATYLVMSADARPDRHPAPDRHVLHLPDRPHRDTWVRLASDLERIDAKWVAFGLDDRTLAEAHALADAVENGDTGYSDSFPDLVARAPAGTTLADPAVSATAFYGLSGKLYRRAPLIEALQAAGSAPDDEWLFVFLLNARLAHRTLLVPDRMPEPAGPRADPPWTAGILRPGSGDTVSADVLDAVLACLETLRDRTNVPSTAFAPVRFWIAGNYPKDTASRDRLQMSVPSDLKRIVYVTMDLSTVGGIQNRTRKILRAAAGRDVHYRGLSITDRHGRAVEGNLVVGDDADAALSAILEWGPLDTVVVFPNNTLKYFPHAIRAALERLPLIFIGSGQLTYLIQDSPVLADPDYADHVRVARHVVFSRRDAQVYDQMGLYDHVVGFHPVDVRNRNDYTPAAVPRIGYVGRIDFYAKAADRLIEAVQALHTAGLPPLRIFTVSDPKNSPQVDTFLEQLTASGLQDHVVFTWDETDPAKIYPELDLLLLPSRKDSFPNVVLEAYSFGVPVLATSHAPGPAELVVPGETGFLVDRFDAATLGAIFADLDADLLTRLSRTAFDTHKRYGMDRYFDFIEGLGHAALAAFAGRNTQRVFPELKPVRVLHDRIRKLDARIAKLLVNVEQYRETRDHLTSQRDADRQKISDLTARVIQARADTAAVRDAEQRRTAAQKERVGKLLASVEHYREVRAKLTSERNTERQKVADLTTRLASARADAAARDTERKEIVSQRDAARHENAGLAARLAGIEASFSYRAGRRIHRLSRRVTGLFRPRG